ALVTAFAGTPPSPSTGLFQFREPRPTAFRVVEDVAVRSPDGRRPDWVTARREDGSGTAVDFGRRVALRLQSGTDLYEVLKGSPLKLSRTVAANFFVLEAADAPAAMNEAQRLAARPEVLVSCPVQRRRQIHLQGDYAARP